MLVEQLSPARLRFQVEMRKTNDVHKLESTPLRRHVASVHTMNSLLSTVYAF
jgi:hypothetical protein